ncbi:glycosyltransferase [Pseudodesulfovibrio cashew]|nr:glycosyltransferase [Pseudodesulfovibrio cashew]
MSGQTMVMLHYLQGAEAHFLQQVDFAEMGYEQLLAEFRGFKSLRSHGMALEFKRLGWNVVEIFGDFRELQAKWAVEHDLPVPEEGWMDRITMAQLDHYRPEAVFCDDISRYPADYLSQRPGYVRCLAAMQGFPMHFKQLAHTDVVFACTPSIAMVFRDCGINVELVYHSFDPSVASGLPERTEDHGFIFTGHSGYGFDWHHRTRYELLRWLLASSPLEAWLTERDMTLFPDIEDPLRELFPHNTHGPVYGMDMYRLMNASKVVLNIHTDAAYGDTGNMRTFEACGVGVCMLVEHSPNIADLYEPDAEVVTYRTREECREKALYLLENEAVRREIGRRAGERTRSSHLAEHRTRQMHESMLRHL